MSVSQIQCHPLQSFMYAEPTESANDPHYIRRQPHTELAVLTDLEHLLKSDFHNPLQSRVDVLRIPEQVLLRCAPKS
jgi:hypothetical protein